MCFFGVWYILCFNVYVDCVYKLCLHIVSTNFSETFLILRRIVITVRWYITVPNGA
jgi:hypothetical protein